MSLHPASPWQEAPGKLVARLVIITGAVVFSAALLVSQGRPVTAGASTTAAAAARIPLLYTTTPEYEASAWLSGGERFPRGATVFINDANGHRPLIEGFAATADAAVSFDAKDVVFAGKRRAGDRWQIWIVAARGGAARQFTRSDEDCVRPFYLQPDAIVYARKSNGRFVIEVRSLVPADQKPLQLTYAAGSSLPTDVLVDGRVLFEAALPPEGSGTSEIYTVYSDGSGVESYRCDHGRSRTAARQVPSGDVVFAEDGRLARFTSALAHGTPIAAPAGSYAGDVTATKDGAWLVSWRKTDQDRYEVRRWKPGSALLQPDVLKAGVHVIQPVLVTPHPVPNRHPSGLHDNWPYANVLCLNAYTSKQRFADGSIASARVFVRDEDGDARLLGTAPVEKDGSFFVRVPGDQPIRIELVDAGGRSLHGEAGWFWLRKGEQRICVGCHAGPETAPDNAVPAILQRSTAPADLTKGTVGTTTGGH